MKTVFSYQSACILQGKLFWTVLKYITQFKFSVWRLLILFSFVRHLQFHSAAQDPLRIRSPGICGYDFSLSGQFY